MEVRDVLNPREVKQKIILLSYTLKVCLQRALTFFLLTLLLTSELGKAGINPHYIVEEPKFRNSKLGHWSKVIQLVNFKAGSIVSIWHNFVCSMSVIYSENNALLLFWGATTPPLFDHAILMWLIPLIHSGYVLELLLDLSRKRESLFLLGLYNLVSWKYRSYLPKVTTCDMEDV